MDQAVDRTAVEAALPGYEIGEVLGWGPDAIVWDAYDPFGQPVAVKQLYTVLTADDDVRRRFRSATELLPWLDHPHVARVHDAVEHEGLCLLVRKRLDGGSVRHRVVAGRHSWPAACAVVLGACAALDHADSRFGLLHGGIKPANLLFDSDGRLAVTDFGVAHVVSEPGQGRRDNASAYTAPEILQCGGITASGDVYAMGAVLYQLLTGRLPFAESAPMARFFEDPTPLIDVAPGLPRPIAAVTMRAIARERTLRYLSVEAFGAELATATSEVWETGWIARDNFVVSASGRIAENLLRRPPLRDTGCDERLSLDEPAEDPARERPTDVSTERQPAEDPQVGDELAADRSPQVPAARASFARSEPPGALVYGVMCARGHLNAPDAAFCRTDGSRSLRVDRLVLGPRPPLGVLVIDDGTVYPVDQDLVIGRDPHVDAEVKAGIAQGIELTDPDRTIGRVHARITLHDWAVRLSDSGSANGTYVAEPDAIDWTQVPVGTEVVLRSDMHILVGTRVISFASLPDR